IDEATPASGCSFNHGCSQGADSPQHGDGAIFTARKGGRRSGHGPVDAGSVVRECGPPKCFADVRRGSPSLSDEPIEYLLDNVFVCPLLAQPRAQGETPLPYHCLRTGESVCGAARMKPLLDKCSERCENRWRTGVDQLTIESLYQKLW